MYLFSTCFVQIILLLVKKVDKSFKKFRKSVEKLFFVNQSTS